MISLLTAIKFIATELDMNKGDLLNRFEAPKVRGPACSAFV
jgi:hypothetical protein